MNLSVAGGVEQHQITRRVASAFRPQDNGNNRANDWPHLPPHNDQGSAARRARLRGWGTRLREGRMAGGYGH